MRTNHLIRLAELATDVVAIDGGELVGIQLGEMADGSGRSFALVSTDSAGLEQEYRIASPAPADAPAWARSFGEWSLEVRTGERWLDLELELEADGRIGTAPELEALAGGVDPAPLASAVDDADLVNHEALAGMSDDALAELIVAGGPTALIVAAQHERESRPSAVVELDRDADAERAYEIASADVVLPLTREDAETIADGLDLLRDIADGNDERNDYYIGSLARLAQRIRLELEQAEARS